MSSQAVTKLPKIQWPIDNTQGTRVIQLFRADPKDDHKGWYGTGWHIQAKYGHFIITNAHVCGKSRFLRGTRSDKIIGYDLVVVGVAKDADLCLLVAEDAMFLGDGYPLSNASPSPGETLYSYGYSSGGPLRAKSFSYKGWALMRSDRYAKPEATGVVLGAVFPGDSGSPVLNSHGNIVGVICARNEETTIGYFVPLEQLVNFLTNNESSN
jgi:serine protease Do